MADIDFIDLFGGVGGFRHGLENASDRFNCVGYYDKDKYATRSYNAIFNENHEPTDVSELDESEFPNHELLCAGFPCQSFSIAGKRKGFEDTRGTLFFEIARIAEAKKPEVLLLENVKGLLSHDNGRTFATILQALDELGYYVKWQVLNSKHWGVPQNRERVFIIGHLGGEPGRKVFPIQREDTEDSGQNGQSANLDTIHDNRPEIGQANRVYESDGLLPALNGGWTPQIQEKGLNTTEDGASFCIDSNYHKGTSPGDIGSGRRTQIIKNHRNREIRDHGQISPTINKIQGGGQEPMVINHQFRPEDRPSIQNGQSGGSGLLYNEDYNYALSGSPHYVKPTLTPERVEKQQNGRRMKENEDPMFTLTGQDIHGVSNGVRIRKLTPKECWRLQGFPDKSFEKAQEAGISDTQLYKQAGNAVTVNVIQMLGEELLKLEIFSRKEKQEVLFREN